MWRSNQLIKFANSRAKATIMYGNKTAFIPEYMEFAAKNNMDIHIKAVRQQNKRRYAVMLTKKSTSTLQRIIQRLSSF